MMSTATETETEAPTDPLALLDEAVVGSSFHLDGGAAWVKQDNGRWSPDTGGSSLPSRYFAGYATAGRLVWDPAPTPEPDPVGDLFPDTVGAPEQESEVGRFTDPRLVDRLLNFAVSTANQDLMTVLGQFGISREVAVEVQVVLSGYTHWHPTVEIARQWTSLGAVEITGVEDTVRVLWRREFTVTRQAQALQCACHLVSDDDQDVQSMMPGDYEECDYAVSCANND